MNRPTTGLLLNILQNETPRGNPTAANSDNIGIAVGAKWRSNVMGTVHDLYLL